MSVVVTSCVLVASRDLESEWLTSSAGRDGAIARVPGISGMAWSLKDAEKPVILSKALDLFGSFTMEVWFRLDDPTGVSALWSSQRHRHFVLMIGGGNTVEVRYTDRGTGRRVDAVNFSYDFRPGLWYHFVMTGDGSSGIKYYVNGELIFEQAPFTKQVKRGDITIHYLGAYSPTAEDRYDYIFKGAVDAPAFHDRALSAEEVGESYREAIRGVPVVPLPMQVRYTSEAKLSGGEAEPKLELKTDLLSKDDPGLERLRGALRNSKIGGKVVISRADDKTLPDYVKSMVKEGVPSEGYVLTVRPGRIDLTGLDARGLFYGTDTLVQLLGVKEGVPQVDIFDYPEFPYRAGMWLSDNKPPTTLNDRYGKLSLEGAIERFARHRMNAIMLRLYNYAWLDDPETLKATREIHEYARKHHLEVIPYIQFYGHAKLLLWRDLRTGNTKTVNEEVKLVGTDAAALRQNNVIITDELPIVVKLESGEEMVEGQDYEVIPGELNMSWYPPADVKVNYAKWSRPYIHQDNKPFAIRRIGGGRIPSGATVKVTYDVASGGEGTNPFSTITRELTKNIIKQVVAEFQPQYVHFGVDEIWEPLSPSDRSPRPKDVTPTEAMVYEINETYAAAQEAKPGIKVMYWSDMFDANQTPGWYVTWDGWEDVSSGLIPKEAIVGPWYYSVNLPTLWRASDSMDFFLEKGQPVLGTSGHEPLNQFIWGQATLERQGRYKTDGFTFTIWTVWNELPVLDGGLRAYAQNSWSPSRMPFQNLLKLRLELNALGLSSGKNVGEVEGKVSAYYRNALSILSMLSENELNMVDAEILEGLPLDGLQSMLEGLWQTEEILGQ